MHGRNWATLSEIPAGKQNLGGTALFEKLKTYLDSLDAPDRELRVMRDHELVWSYSSDGGSGNYWVYSVSKITTAVLALQLVEQERIRLEDPLSRYLTEFSHMQVRTGEGLREARNPIKLVHLMSMQAGLDYDLESEGIKSAYLEHGQAASMVDIARGIARSPLGFEPGCGFRYSLCLDVLGAVLMSVEHASLEAQLQERICDRLGAGRMTYHPTEADRARIRRQYARREDASMEEISRNLSYLRETPFLEGGGGGLMADVEGLSLLADALACGGTAASGARILSEDSVRDMRTNRQRGKAWQDFHKIRHVRGYGYGLAVRTLMDPTLYRSPAGEFGWDGNGGGYFVCDPVHHLSIVYLQHVAGDFLSWNQRHPRIRDLVYDALNL